MCLFPFVGKAIHVDDPVYVWIAKQILSNPADFFGFMINWHGTLVPISEFDRNPPGVSYVLAVAAWLGGWNEATLHLAILPFSLAVVLGSWVLARRCCRQPLLAAAVGCATPAFVVSATTLMADVPMLACWVWAVICWDRGMRERKWTAFATAAALVALGGLAKFFAVALIPLLLGWSILQERRPRVYMLWLLLPVMTQLSLDSYTEWRFGHSILFDAAGYATTVGGEIPIVERLIITLAFAGGTLLTTAFFLPWLGSIRARVTALIAIPVLLGVGLALGRLGVAPTHLPDGGIRWDFVLQVSVFAAAALPLIALALAELRQPPGNGMGWMLAAWVLGVFAFAAVFNWTVSTRTILPMAPAAGILVARGLERANVRTSAWLVVPVALGLAVSLMVARADFEWAESARLAANDLAKRYGATARVQFQGHWGFQYYFEQRGATAFDQAFPRISPGAILIEPCNNSNVLLLPLSLGRVVETARYPSSRWLTVHSGPRRVSLYASAFGSLPWALGSAPDETYDVLALQATTQSPREPVKRTCGDGPSKRTTP